jgi:DNA-binding transcriptional MerR regulator
MYSQEQRDDILRKIDVLKKQGYTLQEAADLLKVSVGTICLWRRFERLKKVTRKNSLKIFQ